MCDSVVARGPETALGQSLFAKNSDRPPEECQPFVQHPAAHHAPGSALRCTHIEVPQVAETYAIMGHSPWWIWGLEHGVNEHGVAIGNQAVFSVDPLEARPGLIGADLVRLGLERGRTAREALELMATLIERFGQGGPARSPDAGGYHNSFLLADPTDAWLLETSNRRWAAQQVRLAACSNHYALRDRWDFSSRDFEAAAREAGWWSGEERIDVAAALRSPGIPPHASEGRARRARELLEASRGRHDVETFQRILRDHDAGGTVWTGAHAKPDEERFFTLCAHSDPVQVTTASLVAALPDGRPFGWPVWVSFGTPCTGLFLPVYLDGVIPASLARIDDALDAPAAWLRFKRLQDAAMRDAPRLTPLVREGWKPLEVEIEAERVELEREARSAAIAFEADHARALLSDFMERCASRAFARADALHASLDAAARDTSAPAPSRHASRTPARR